MKRSVYVVLFVLLLAVPMLAQDCVYCHKIESVDPVVEWTAPEGKLVCRVDIKAGTTMLDEPFYEDGCIKGYCVEGLGTRTVRVERTCVESPTCQEISHVSFYCTQNSPTPTPTTETPTPVVETPTPTMSPLTPTPTMSPLTPTPTVVTPTPEPTETVVTPEPTETVVTPEPTEEPSPTPHTGTPPTMPPSPTPTMGITSTPPPRPTLTPTATDVPHTETAEPTTESFQAESLPGTGGERVAGWMLLIAVGCVLMAAGILERRNLT